MDVTRITKNVLKHIKPNKEEFDFFVSSLTTRSVNKGEYLLNMGEVTDCIYYIHSGALRAFHLDHEGKEHTIMFGIADWWITDMYAFVNQKAAQMNIEAISKSQLYELQRKDFDQLLSKKPIFEKFFRILMQNAYVREQLRTIQNLSLTAEKRYLNFLKQYPQTVQLVKQKQIASYLGITPEFLSTIRKKRN